MGGSGWVATAASADGELLAFAVPSPGAFREGDRIRISLVREAIAEDDRQLDLFFRKPGQKGYEPVGCGATSEPRSDLPAGLRGDD